MAQINGKYMYNLSTGETIGIRKSKVTEEDGLTGKEHTRGIFNSDSEDSNGGWVNFYMLGNNTTSNIQYGSVEDLSFTQIVELFLQGNLTKEELKVGLQAKGVTGFNVNDNAGTTSASFKFGDKNYTLNCASDAAASQVDDNIATDTTGNMSVSGGTRVYENFSGELHPEWANSEHTGHYVTDGILSNPLVGDIQGTVENAGLIRADRDRSSWIESLLYNAIPDYFGLTTMHEMKQEHFKFVNEHPEIFHGTFAEYNGKLTNEFHFDIQLEYELTNFMSPEESYYWDIQDFKDRLYGNSKNSLRGAYSDSVVSSPDTDGNNVVFSDDAIQRIFDRLQTHKSRNGFVQPDRVDEEAKFLKLLNISLDDDKETIKKKISSFCTTLGSTDGKTIHIEDYYAALAKGGVCGATYDEYVSKAREVKNFANNTSKKYKNCYGSLENSFLGDLTAMTTEQAKSLFFNDDAVRALINKVCGTNRPTVNSSSQPADNNTTQGTNRASTVTNSSTQGVSGTNRAAAVTNPISTDGVNRTNSIVGSKNTTGETCTYPDENGISYGDMGTARVPAQTYEPADVEPIAATYIPSADYTQADIDDIKQEQYNILLEQIRNMRNQDLSFSASSVNLYSKVGLDSNNNVIIDDNFKNNLKKFLLECSNQAKNPNAGYSADESQIYRTLNLLGIVDSLYNSDELASIANDSSKLNQVISNLYSAIGVSNGGTIPLEKYYDALARYGVGHCSYTHTIGWSTQDLNETFYTEEKFVEAARIRNFYKNIEEAKSDYPALFGLLMNGEPYDAAYGSWLYDLMVQPEDFGRPTYGTAPWNSLLEGSGMISPPGTYRTDQILDYILNDSNRSLNGSLLGVIELAAGITKHDKNSDIVEKLRNFFAKLDAKGLGENPSSDLGHYLQGSVNGVDLWQYLLGNNAEGVNYFATMNEVFNEKARQEEAYAEWLEKYGAEHEQVDIVEKIPPVNQPENSKATEVEGVFVKIGDASSGYKNVTVYMWDQTTNSYKEEQMNIPASITEDDITSRIVSGFKNGDVSSINFGNNQFFLTNDETRELFCISYYGMNYTTKDGVYELNGSYYIFNLENDKVADIINKQGSIEGKMSQLFKQITINLPFDYEYDSSIKVSEYEQIVFENGIIAACGAKFETQEQANKANEIYNYIQDLITPIYQKWYQRGADGEYIYFGNDPVKWQDFDSDGYATLAYFWQNESDRQACFNEMNAAAQQIIDKYGDLFTSFNFDGEKFVYTLEGADFSNGYTNGAFNVAGAFKDFHPGYCQACTDLPVSYIMPDKTYYTNPPEALPVDEGEGTLLKSKYDGILVSTNGNVYVWDEIKQEYYRYHSENCNLAAEILNGDTRKLAWTSGDNYMNGLLMSLVFKFNRTSVDSIFEKDGIYYMFDSNRLHMFGYNRFLLVEIDTETVQPKKSESNNTTSNAPVFEPEEINDEPGNAIYTNEEYKAEATKQLENLQKKVGTVIKDGDTYYNLYNNKKYNYLWDPFDHKWLTYEAAQLTNGKANDSQNKALLRIQMILAALKQGLSFTANPKIYKDKEGNSYYYDEQLGVFEKQA